MQIFHISSATKIFFSMLFFKPFRMLSKSMGYPLKDKKGKFPILVLGLLLIMHLSFHVIFLNPLYGEEDWNKKGLSLAQSHHYDEAIRAFSQAIETEPDNAEPYNNRGAAWQHKGNYDRAIEDYTRALIINPRYADAYNNRGAAWYQKGDYDRAIADYDMVLQGIDRFLENHLERAFTGESKGLDINPRYADVYNNRGASWLHKGELDRAIADYTTALQIDSKSIRALNNRGMAWYKKGEFAMAIEDYSHALRLDPNFIDAMNQLAWTMAVCPDERYRNGPKSLELAIKVVEKSPGPNSLDTLAAAYAEIGRYDEAVETQRRVLSLRNREGSGEALSNAVERLKTYSEKKPWREIPKSMKSKNKEFPHEGIVKVMVGNVRTLPSTESRITGKLLKENRVTLLHQEDEWYIVKLSDNRLGWVHRSLFEDKRDDEAPRLTPEKVLSQRSKEESFATVRVTSGRVRQFPSLTSPIKFGLKNGTVVSILAEDGDWHQIKTLTGRTGWAHKILFKDKLVTTEIQEFPDEPDEKSPSFELSEPISGDHGETLSVQVDIGRIRQAPSLDSHIKYRLKKGALVRITKTAGDWHFIETRSGRTGWAHQSLFD